MSLDSLLSAILALVQIDIGNRGLARDPSRNFFQAFPGDFANACRSIAHHPRPRLGIVTGFMIAGVEPPTGETDGPLGTLFLARVFHRLGMPCMLLSDDAGFAALDAGLIEIGLRQSPLVSLRRLSVPGQLPDGLPGEFSHLVAVERCGPSHADGRPYSMRGRDLTPWTAPAHELFEQPRSYRTIGIGDGGNEIGMGKLPFEWIAANIPHGEQVACRTATDDLIVCGISNWGAYALAAGTMLARERHHPEWFDTNTERRLLETLVSAGYLVDGVTGERTATVDGLTWEQYSGPLTRIRELLTQTRKTPQAWHLSDPTAQERDT